LIPIGSFDAPLPAITRGALRASIAGATVIGLGESRHDTREQLLLKKLLVRHLVEELGFRVLILEESFPHAQSLDRYVSSGEGDLQEIMSRLAGWYLWDTEEMLDLMRWLRTFNESRPPDRRVRVFGMDITAPAPGVRTVLDSLRSAGVGVRLDGGTLGLDLQEGDFWPATWERYAALPERRREELAESYEELVRLVGASRDRLAPVFSKSESDRLLWLAEVGRMGNKLFSSADREKGGIIREHGMAQAILWILEREAPGGRAILWAHNLHVAKAPFRMPGLAEGPLEPMGIELSKQLGERYLAIGGTFGTGSFPASLPPGERHFDRPPEDTMDGAMARVGAPLFLTDLRDVERGSAAEDWLGQPRGWRAQDTEAVLVPSEAFDLVYFTARISRSRPTARALERFQSLGNRR